ncbi:putative calcium-binding protein CML31 [Vitis vinifera]|uniref:Putative calcium-binding protein CML31 n=1 Tax=Vitis vinifera TaxID=29760 RepID=A0A438FS61_VITVI|nr:putative calcium-binding protein CML31 [Vitis vinifera]
MINCNVYERIFKRFDEDGDGKLSPSELRRCLGTIGEELLMEEAQEVVESMDSDGDGLLGLGGICGVDGERGLKRMLSRLGESRSVEECSVMIAQFDVNGDGVLSFDEFKLMLL